MSAKKGLGRGFASLIPSELLDESFDPSVVGVDGSSDLRNIKLSEILPDPNQPRRTFNEQALAELSASIKEHGVLQPIVVVTEKGGGYSIVAGERRYRASILAGLEKIPAIVRTLTSQHKLELSLIENVQRQDLTVVETAYAYQTLRDQFNLSLDEIGKRVGGRSASTISNTLRLLKLPESVQKYLMNGTLTEGQARPLVNLTDMQIKAVIQRIVDEQWNSREVERYVASIKSAEKQKAPLKKPVEPRYKKQADTISKYFSMPVAISSNKKGKGKIVISFSSEDELESLFKKIR